MKQFLILIVVSSILFSCNEKKSVEKPTVVDTDKDGVPDSEDKCPNVVGLAANQGCPEKEKDTDGDGVEDEKDNCKTKANADQKDTDGDGIGDACDDFQDTDGDGVEDEKDNCKTKSNADQKDTDGDGIGDACDDFQDTDGDGVEDEKDQCKNEKGVKENNGCPWANLKAGVVEFPKDKQSCIQLPIEIQITATTGGSSKKEYRYRLRNLTNTNEQEVVSEYTTELKLPIKANHIKKGNIYKLIVDVKDAQANQTAEYTSIRFHVRGEPVTANAVPVATFVNPVKSGGVASTAIEWANIEGLNYSVYINGEEKASRLSERKYVHQLSKGTYKAVIKSIDSNGNYSKTAVYAFQVE